MKPLPHALSEGCLAVTEQKNMFPPPLSKHHLFGRLSLAGTTCPGDLAALVYLQLWPEVSNDVTGRLATSAPTSGPRPLTSACLRFGWKRLLVHSWGHCHIDISICFLKLLKSKDGQTLFTCCRYSRMIYIPIFQLLIFEMSSLLIWIDSTVYPSVPHLTLPVVHLRCLNHWIRAW